ncbi:MAG: hypothetical protein P8Y99_07930 [Calditrichaceae bacterium]
MKRLLITTSIFVTFLGLILTASPYLLKLFGIDNTVKRYVLSELIDNSKGQLDVQNFQIGLGKVILSDVSLNSSSKKFQISLESIEFNFNFFKLFSSPTKPQNAIESVYLVEPNLVLSASESNDSKDVDVNGTNKRQIKEVFLSISKLSSIDRIQIVDGQIIWRSYDNEMYPLVDDLNGWLAAKSMDDMSVEARGKLFNTNADNLFLNSKIDFDNEYLDASVIINDYQINSSDYPVIPGKVTLDSGIFVSTIHVHNKGFVIDSTVLNGVIKISDLNIHHEKYDLNNLFLKVNIDTNAVLISDGTAKFEDSEIRMNGHIENLLDPLIVSDITIRNLGIHYFLTNFDSELLKKAHVNSKIHLKYGYKVKSAEINSWADKLYFGKNDHIDDFKIRAFLKYDSIDIRNVSGKINNFEVNGNGLYDQSKNLLSIHLGSQHTFGTHVLLDRLSDKHLLFDLSMEMNTESGKANGNWLYQLENDSDTLLYAEGNIIGGIDQKLTIALLNSNKDDFFANIEISDYLKSPIISEARIVNFPFADFTTNGFIKKPISRFNTDMQLNGSLSNLTGNIDVIDKTNFRNRFNLNANIDNLFTNQRKFYGKILLKNLAGEYQFLHTETFFGGAFNFADEIDGFIKIDLQDKEQLAGEINFKEFQFIKSLADSVFTEDIKEEADEFSAKKFVCYLNNLPILNGSVAYSTTNQNLFGSFTGHEIDLDPIISTIKSDNNFLNGIANYGLELEGNIDAPVLSGHMQIKDGELKRIPFDHLNISFEDSLKPSSPIIELKNHVLKFSNLDFEKLGNYHITASGEIPFNYTDPLSVKGIFIGDILGFIPRLNNFFVDGTSLSEIDFKLGGTLNKVRIERGYAEIEKGELWLDKVVPHIENIHGRSSRGKSSTHSGAYMSEFTRFVLIWILVYYS